MRAAAAPRLRDKTLRFTLPHRRARARRLALALGWSLLSIGVVAASYFLAHGWLEGRESGNDIPYAFTHLAYLDRWAPPVPGWFHAQGAGMYFLGNYAPGTFLALWALLQALPFGDVEAFRVATFAAIPLTALGVALLAARWTGRFAAGAIAAALFLASPLSWTWLISYGFVAQVVAIAATPFAAVAIDAYLIRGGPRRLLLAASLAALAASFHPFSGVLALGFGLALGVVRRSLGRALLATVSSIGLGAAFWVPFLVKTARATDRSLSYIGADLIPFRTPAQDLGIPSSSLIDSAESFHALAVALFGLGLFVAWRRGNRLMLGLGIVAVAILVLLSLPLVAPVAAVQPLARLYYAFVNRPVAIAGLLVPIVAAAGTVAIAAAAAQRIGRWLVPLGEAVAVVVVGAAIVASGQAGPHFKGPLYAGENGLGRATSATFRVDGSPVWGALPIPEIVRELRLDAHSRIDVSPRLGAVTESLNIASDASQVNAYFYAGSLIHVMWGYEQQVIFAGLQPTETRNLVDWFGLEHVLVRRDVDPVDHLVAAGLVRRTSWGLGGSSAIDAYSPLDAKGVVTVARGPVVLVIGDVGRAAFESFFRAGAAAGLGYGDVLLVDGGERLDAYDEEALAAFDALFLYGYHAGDRSRAWGAVRKYVEGGGRAFVDTGWQFVSDDWESTSLPLPSPVAATRWVELNEWSFRAAPDPLFAGVDLERFGPARSGAGGWGVSSGTARTNAETLLQSGSRPILARLRLGSGEVLWSGMNLLGHYQTYGSPDEARLVANIARELAGPRRAERRADWTRLRPERVEVRLESGDAGSWVLFREAAAPEWRATLDGRELRTWKAGPGFLLVRLPADAPDGTLLFAQQTARDGLVGAAVSLLVGIALAWSALRGSPPALGLDRIARRLGRALEEREE